jgi:PPOX class probable F420-dependent enzyme
VIPHLRVVRASEQGSAVPREQRRARRIAMSPAELDEFLAAQRTCRVGTVGGDGAPHVSPLWFVWDGRALWLNSIVKSQRWANFVRDPRVSVVVDGGDAYGELRGVELIGRVELVGDVPRSGNADDELAEPERLFGEKYAGGVWAADGRHAWARLVPDKIVSWDFRKLGAVS